jgi:hypothetical protein
MSDYDRVLRALHDLHGGKGSDMAASQALGYLSSAVPSAGGDHQGIADAIRELFNVKLSAADVQALWEQKLRLDSR